MTRSRATRPPLPNSPFAAKPAPVLEVYDVDERVAHDVYGMGRVVALEPKNIVLVDFGSQLVRVPNDRRLCKL